MGAAIAAAFSFCGNLTAASILLCGDVVASTVSWLARTGVDMVDWSCGSGRNTVRRKVAWHPQRFSTDPAYKAGSESFGELDSDAMLARSTFPIKPEVLIEKARSIIKSEFGTADLQDGSCLADDFQFVAPIIGPLSKTEFLEAFGSFKLKDAVPDMKENSWFQVDPLEPNRVWWFGRAKGTHTGPLVFGGQRIPGKGMEILSPPQAQSMLFDEQGKCYTMTVGYCMDKRIGNTNGLGALLGILKAIGKPLPFPEANNLYTPSLRYEAFEHVAKALECIGIKPVGS